MNASVRMAAVALAMTGSGCSYSVCIYEDTACVNTVEFIGDSPDDVFACDEVRSFTTCKDEGFTYECNDVWYRLPCR
jgi:hypothetical protein